MVVLNSGRENRLDLFPFWTEGKLLAAVSVLAAINRYTQFIQL
jgi:hypothetical protein